jgi:hypothetical protein
LINVGFRRSATVGRCVGDGSRQTPTEFAAFCPVALAGIGDCLPDTVVDRAVVLRMRRRAPDEIVEALRYRRVRPEAEQIRARLAAWGEAHVDVLSGADPVMPEGVTDRPADTWEALLAVADAAGGFWPKRARAACVALNRARTDEDPNIVIRLLGAIRTVFDLEGEHVFSSRLCDALNADDEAPWSGWNDGKGIQPRDVARRLKGFGIASKQIRIGDVTRKGYAVASFTDTFDRYLSSNETKETRETPLISTVSHVSPVSPNGDASELDEVF